MVATLPSVITGAPWTGMVTRASGATDTGDVVGDTGVAMSCSTLASRSIGVWTDTV